MATIKQIAERCGVSVSTVSKALNGAEDVSRSTITRIRKVAEEMGYVPNAAARALKTSRSYCFGILIADSVAQHMPHEFFSKIIVSFQRRASELGYDITSVNDRLGGREIGFAEHARYRNCDGIIVLAGSETDNSVIPELVETGIPVICIDYGVPGCGSVCSDNEQGMRALVSYIVALGHRKIAYIYGHDTWVTRSRIEAYRAVCAEHGIVLPPEYLVPALYHDAALAEEATRQLLSMADPPSCILYPDDLAFVGGMNELERRGLSLPKSVSAAAYDGLDIGQTFHPKLTTIRQNAEGMGRCAAEELARAIQERENYDCRRILIPGTLLRGETVRPINA